MSFEKYDCGSLFSPKMFCVRAHPCRIICHKNKTYEQDSDTICERIANTSRKTRNILWTGYVSNTNRTTSERAFSQKTILFLIVRRLTSVCCSDFCFLFNRIGGCFLFGCTPGYHPSHGWIRGGTFARQNRAVGCSSCTRQNIIRDLVGFTVGHLLLYHLCGGMLTSITQGFIQVMVAFAVRALAG